MRRHVWVSVVLSSLVAALAGAFRWLRSGSSPGPGEVIRRAAGGAGEAP